MFTMIFVFSTIAGVVASTLGAGKVAAMAAASEILCRQQGYKRGEGPYTQKVRVVVQETALSVLSNFFGIPLPPRDSLLLTKSEAESMRTELRAVTYLVRPAPRKKFYQRKKGPSSADIQNYEAAKAGFEQCIGGLPWGRSV